MQRLPDVRGFELDRELGAGANAVTYKARKLRSGEWVALKQLPIEKARIELAALRRLVGSKYAARLVGKPVRLGGFVFLPMDLCEAPLQVLSQRRVPPAVLARLALDPVARLIRDAERCGLVFYDLNGVNFMLRGTELLLIDFGSATTPGRHESVESTPGFEPPETPSGVALYQTMSWAWGAITRCILGLRWDVEMSCADVLAGTSWLGQPLAQLIAECTAFSPLSRPHPCEVQARLRGILRVSTRRCRRGHVQFSGARTCPCGQ